MYQRVLRVALAYCGCLAGLHFSAGAAGFEGKIHAVGGRSGAVAGLLYTVGTNCMRVEMTDTNFPNAIDLVDLSSGQITLVQPMNHTFLRFNPNAVPPFPGRNPGGPAFAPAPPPMPNAPPGMPPGAPATIGPTNLPGMPAMPPMPQPQNGLPPNGLPPGMGPQALPPGGPAMQALAPNPGMGAAMAMRRPEMTLQLQTAEGQTNLLGYDCRHYLIQTRGETMDIWATDKLLPFQVYLPNQPPSFGPPMIEFQWSRLLAEKKLFPLLASMHGENGMELYHFEVQSIAAGSLTGHEAQNEAQNRQPPGDYIEVQPRPF